MKRSDAITANSRLRKRITNNDETGNEDLQSLLSEQEIAELKQAYQNGCRGNILIGLRGEVRVLTILLPPKPDKHSTDKEMGLSMTKLQDIGCDGYIHIHRALISPQRNKDAETIILIDHCIRGKKPQSILLSEVSIKV